MFAYLWYVNLQVLLSPVESRRSQNIILGLVASTISPLSPLQGAYEVSGNQIDNSESEHYISYLGTQKVNKN
jgi:hypothetical protein